ARRKRNCETVLTRKREGSESTKSDFRTPCGVARVDGNQETNRGCGGLGSPAMNGPVCPRARTVNGPGPPEPASLTQPASAGLPQDRPVHSWPGHQACRIPQG